MSLKIGLLTTYFSKNYGAVLQAYATEKKLSYMGYNCEIIAYQNNEKKSYTSIIAIDEERKKPFSDKLKRKLKNAFIKIKRPYKKLVVGSALRNRAFDEFAENYLNISKTSYFTSDEFINSVPSMPYDVFLCGSDQIWNPIVHKFDDVYYLNFPTKAKKIAYASSIAFNKFTKSEIERIAKSISSIDRISVRERSTVEWLQPYVKKRVHSVIDPTFLLNKDEWLELKSNKTFEGKYILVYLLNYNEQNKNTVSLISDLARKIGARIICLPYTKIKFKKDIQVEYRYDIAPNDFINLLKNAQCVVTNSFHATALSINLNIPFYVVSSRERNKDLQTRLSDLLEEMGLEDRKIYIDTTFINNDVIDFASANTIVENRRNEGIKYLEQALKP